MLSPIEQFRENIARVQALGGLHTAFSDEQHADKKSKKNWRKSKAQATNYLTSEKLRKVNFYDTWWCLCAQNSGGRCGGI